jgi:hypothetical protein
VLRDLVDGLELEVECRHLTLEDEERVVQGLRRAFDADIGIVARRLIAQAEDLPRAGRC